MPVVAYTPDHFGLLEEALRTVPHARSLLHRPFVDWYYTTSDWCRLHLALLDDGSLGACLGLERLVCENEGRAIEIGVASNYTTFQPGTSAPMLFLKWIRSHPYGCVFGGTADVHAIVSRQKWTYYGGIRTWQINAPYPPSKRDDLLRRTAKSLLRAVAPRTDLRRLGEAACERENLNNLRVEEEGAVTADMLPPPGTFSFRLAPTIDYLNWRYATGLRVVRYRIFRILRDGKSAGFVVTNDKPDWIMVAHADATSPEVLAVASLMAVARVAADGDAKRTAMLATSHPAMQAIYRRAGFRPNQKERDFVVGTRQGPSDLPADTSSWSVHFDWTDNGLRSPFLDETAND